jgi:prephenate dehydratase
MAIKIAIQGAEASYHDIAARQLFGNDAARVFCETFPETFQALADSTADYALCAIENSLYGSINEIYDLLQKYGFQIVGEIHLRIEHCLIGLPGATIEKLQKVYSHPVALAQCTAYLDTTLRHAEREEFYDTAASVTHIKQVADRAFAAIASEQAAILQGMKVLAQSIESNKQNFTRFIALRKAASTKENRDKTSLVLTTDHKPGALYEALGAFAKRSINLTKLQSRPVIGKAWHYMFYVDVAAGTGSPKLREALQELRAQGCSVTILGSYQAHEL